LDERSSAGEVIRSLKSGKEATVYAVRSGTRVRCAKVYRDMGQRSFQKRAQYWLSVADALISPSPPTLMVLFTVVLLESLDVFVWVPLLVLCVYVSVYTVLLPNIGEAGPRSVVCV
jgi:hypothetical protein